MSNNLDTNLEMLIDSAKKLGADDQAELIKALTGVELPNLESVTNAAKKLGADDQAELIKSLIGSDGLTFVLGGNIRNISTVDVAFYIQSADKEVFSSVAEALSDRIRRHK